MRPKLAGLESPLLRERANDIRDVGRRVLALLTGSPAAGLEAPRRFHPHRRGTEPLRGGPAGPHQGAGPLHHHRRPHRPRGHPGPVPGHPRHLRHRRSRAGSSPTGAGGAGRQQGDPAAPPQRRRNWPRPRTRRPPGRQRVHERGRPFGPAVTADGVAIEVAANIRNAQEAREAVAAGAEGVGLLRSEFLFLDRETAPTEDEQAAEYCRRGQAPGSRPQAGDPHPGRGRRQAPALPAPAQGRQSLPGPARRAGEPGAARIVPHPAAGHPARRAPGGPAHHVPHDRHPGGAARRPGHPGRGGHSPGASPPRSG
jgi:hypothetical protein